MNPMELKKGRPRGAVESGWGIRVGEWGLGQRDSDPLLDVQDQGLQEVEKIQRKPGLGAHLWLKQALEELVAGSR